MAAEVVEGEAGEAAERAPEVTDAQPPTGAAALEAPRGPEVAPPATTRQPYHKRFRALYAVLVLCVGAGAAGVVLAATGGSLTGSGPAWSAWKPSGGGLGAVDQIAAHISAGYRLPDGHQLVDVIARPSSITAQGKTIPVPLIAVRGPKGKVDQVEQVSNSDTFMLSMCGLGQSCSIATGKPSVQRGTLVRREILELALYTFKYVHGAQRIVAFMPPTPGASPTYVVYLQRNDLAPELQVPLTHTLSKKVPLPSQISSREQEKIDALTESKIYKFGLSQTQQGEPVLVLDPLTA